MKAIIVIISLLVFTPLPASEHPRIYVSDADREKIKGKIERAEWAGTIYQKLKKKIYPYVSRHRTNPEWIVSRLAMYWKEGERYTQCYLKDQHWDRGEGNAPVPTVRMPGMRIWNQYQNVPLEERIPYNETGDMWGVSRTNPDAGKVLVPYKQSGHMIRSNNVEILTLAEEAAFLYWLTGEEAYAAFSSDVFQVWLMGTYYMNPIADPGQSTGGKGGYEPGGICGYYDYEQIHDDLALHAAVIYDFIHGYLKLHPHPHWAEAGIDMEKAAGIVFKRFIDIGFVRGGKSGNWNVNGWNMLLRPILALEENGCYADGKGRSYYLHYLTTESTPFHDAIPDILKSYDPVTGLWPESPGYSFSTVSMLAEFSSLLMRCGMDILADNAILQKAALAMLPWMDSRGNLIVFGDSRGGKAGFGTLERLLAYYTQTGDSLCASRVAAVLRQAAVSGNYRREDAGWTALCTYVEEIPDVPAGSRAERMSYSPFHRLVTMKNGQGEESLMAVLYGGREGSHLSPNGLALQLYGFGYALSPDASGYESYWSDDYRYHQSATGSNTILPGYTEGPVEINFMEPAVEKGCFTDTAALSPFINVCGMQAGEKSRVVALVKNAACGGYYVDIFRSGQADNDYLWHNVGTSLQLEDKDGQRLPTVPVAAFDTIYSPGYAWFRNLRKTAYENPFKAVWQIDADGQPFFMHVWMTGAKGRELYAIEAPCSTLLPELAPGGASAAPHHTPVLLVRQSGNNGWDSPFVAVMEPVKGKAAVKDVEAIHTNRNIAALCVCLENGQKDYIFSATAPDSVFSSGGDRVFQGSFGIVTELSGCVRQLYLVNGRKIKKGSYALESAEPVSAAVYQKGGRWFYSSTGELSIQWGEKFIKVNAGYGIPLHL